MVENTGFFKGKTVLISGASRGIGLAIVKKLAADGANIVVAAKTDKPHPTLPAKEIEEAGGQCLPIVMDVRFEDQVKAAVEQAVQRFGGIDIVVNNASAIALTGTTETDMKRYDLMHQVNTRGTFLLSKLALPHLRRSANPHILNISPPLIMEQQWFQHHAAYTMAKYGMSMCVLGMAHEFKRDGIAVNALWPRTSVWTAAIRLTSSDKEAQRHCRKDTIMADAAYLMLSKPSRHFTAKFMIDDEVLCEHGITDFDQYKFDKDADLVYDFFIPGIQYNGPRQPPKL